MHFPIPGSLPGAIYAHSSQCGTSWRNNRGDHGIDQMGEFLRRDGGTPPRDISIPTSKSVTRPRGKGQHLARRSRLIALGLINALALRMLVGRRHARHPPTTQLTCRAAAATCAQSRRFVHNFFRRSIELTAKTPDSILKATN